MKNNLKKRLSGVSQLRSVAVVCAAVLFTGCTDLGYLLRDRKSVV